MLHLPSVPRRAASIRLMRGPVTTAAWIALIVALFLPPFGFVFYKSVGFFLVGFAVTFAIVSALAVGLAGLHRK